MNTTDWPEGVVERYLTAGGATVDITFKSTEHEATLIVACVVTCGGCSRRWSDLLGTFDQAAIPEDPFTLLCSHGQSFRRDARDHAEKCRAMPRPSSN